MTFLSKEIETLTSPKGGTNSLIQKTVSCGIFQDYEDHISRYIRKSADIK